MNIDTSILLKHVAYSLGSACIALAFALAVGRFFYKINSILADRSQQIARVLRFFPVRTLVFGIVGLSLFSPVGIAYFLSWFGPSPYWVPVSTSMGLGVIGSWIYATHLCNKKIYNVEKGFFFRLSRSLFVASPWLCMKPGLLIGGSGGSLITKGLSQMDFATMWSGVSVVVIISLLIDITFGIFESNPRRH